MSRKLILALAVLAISFAGASFAAVENIKISGDITTEAVTRDFGFGGADDNDAKYLFSQIRLRFDADLTEGVSAVVSLLNERIWGQEETDGLDGNTELALDLAYIELKEFIYEPLTLIVGRQNLRYGNALIIGDPDTNQYANANVPVELRDVSLRKSFDAVRGILDFAPWTIDLIFAKVEENTLLLNDDVTVVGANAAYDWSSYNGVTEVYFYSVNNAPRSATTSVIDSKDKVYVLGSRAQADLNDNLTLGLEGAYQFGDYQVSTSDHRHLSAFAVQAIAEYRLLDDKNTKLGLNYAYLSGDNGGGTDSAFNGWDPLFEDQSPGEIINILFSNTNMQYWKLSASTMPQEDITVGLDYIYARLAQDNPSGTTTLSVTGTAAANFTTASINSGDKEIGHEIDLYGIYDYTEDVQLKLTGGWLIPGNLFADGNDNVGYSVRGGVNVSF
ncbi:MAG: alginate export family protein [Candidatus Omnitrophica bacterium]|nr:alginate export family protein [Candidatus Omnitrophota bacterium]